jgi:glycosyltransferase involved in cell wall biosynthesis
MRKQIINFFVVAALCACPVLASAYEFGVVDTSQIFSKYKVTQKTKETLETKKTELQKDLENRKEDVKKIDDEYVSVAKQLQEITFKVAGPVSGNINNIDKPNNLIFLGPLSKQEVKKLLLESDVFLFPSYTEGFANALLEAMAMGLPIITTPVGANVDMIESMGGLIVEVGNSNSIMDAINNIRSSIDRSRMSVWNLNKVMNEYTIEKVMDKLIFIYLDIISK